MGGRAAEEIIFGPEKVTTGASNDLKVCFLLACTKIYYQYCIFNALPKIIKLALKSDKICTEIYS